MATIEKFGAPGVFEPATYSQGVRVTQAQTILFLSGQVAYTPDGRARMPRRLQGRRRAEPTRRSRRWSSRRAGRWRTSSRSRPT